MELGGEWKLESWSVGWKTRCKRRQGEEEAQVCFGGQPVSDEREA